MVWRHPASRFFSICCFEWAAGLTLGTPWGASASPAVRPSLLPWLQGRGWLGRGAGAPRDAGSTWGEGDAAGSASPGVNLHLRVPRAPVVILLLPGKHRDYQHRPGIPLCTCHRGSTQRFKAYREHSHPPQHNTAEPCFRVLCHGEDAVGLSSPKGQAPRGDEGISPGQDETCGEQVAVILLHVRQ